MAAAKAAPPIAAPKPFQLLWAAPVNTAIPVVLAEVGYMPVVGVAAPLALVPWFVKFASSFPMVTIPPHGAGGAVAHPFKKLPNIPTSMPDIMTISGVKAGVNMVLLAMKTCAFIWLSMYEAWMPCSAAKRAMRNAACGAWT